MPAWEKFLNEDEMWDVILFLYDYTDQRPRGREEGVRNDRHGILAVLADVGACLAV